MPITDELVPVLKKLRLSGVLNTLDLRTREAVDQDLSHGEFLFRLCTDEVGRRESKQLELRLRRASFESTKRIEDFEWSFNPQIPKAKIIDLATCHFVERQENTSGVGSFHLRPSRNAPLCSAPSRIQATARLPFLGLASCSARWMSPNVRTSTSPMRVRTSETSTS